MGGRGHGRGKIRNRNRLSPLPETGRKRTGISRFSRRTDRSARIRILRNALRLAATVLVLDIAANYTPMPRHCNSLPLPVQPPIPQEKIFQCSHSLPVSDDLSISTRAIRQQVPDGPVLHVTIAGISFYEAGRYFLTLSSSGLRHHTHVWDGRSQRFAREQHFQFPLDETSLDLELCICATRVRAASPTSVREAGNATDAADQPSGWQEHLGTSTLRLSQLLSCPQPAGSSKMYELKLFSPHEAQTPVGTVSIRWNMEDRAAEAREAAVRAADLHKQKVAAASAPSSAVHQAPTTVYFPATTGTRDHAFGQKRVRIGVGARNQPMRSDEAARETEAEDFDAALTLIKWQDVLDSYRVALWLPPGTSPATLMLTARQAVGLSDVATRHKSGRVAFSHAGMRITLSREVSSSLRARVEEKLDLTSHAMAEDSTQAILIMADSGCLVSHTERAVTVGGGEPPAGRSREGAAEERCGGSSQRHFTAEPTNRPRPIHAHSTKWHDAAALPLARSPPSRVYHDGRVCTLETPPTTPRVECPQSHAAMRGGANDDDEKRCALAMRMRGATTDEVESSVPRRAALPRRASSPPRTRPAPSTANNERAVERVTEAVISGTSNDDDEKRRSASAAAVKPGLSLSDIGIADGATPSRSRVPPVSAALSPHRSPSFGSLPAIGAASACTGPAVSLASSASVAVLPSQSYQRAYGTPAPVAAASGGAPLGLTASRSLAQLTMEPPTYTPRGLYGGMRAGSCANLTGLREPAGRRR